MTRQEKEILDQAAVRICTDFDQFCRYTIDNKVTVPIATGDLGKQDCFAINQFMTAPEPYDTADHSICEYALVQYLQFAAVWLRVVDLQYQGDGRAVITKGKWYEQFSRLAQRSRYLLLFFCFVYEYAAVLKLESVLRGEKQFSILDHLAESVVGVYIPDNAQTRKAFWMEVNSYSHLLRILTAMDLCEAEFQDLKAVSASKMTGTGQQILSGIGVKSIRTTAAGVILARCYLTCESEADQTILAGTQQTEMKQVLLRRYVKAVAPDDWFLIREICMARVNKPLQRDAGPEPKGEPADWQNVSADAKKTMLAADELMKDFYHRYPAAELLTSQYLSSGGRAETRLRVLRKRLPGCDRFHVWRMPGSWSEAIAFHTRAELLQMCEKAGIWCSATEKKEQLQLTLSWHFTHSDIVLTKLLDRETKATLKYLYDQEGAETERTLEYEPLEALLLSGLIDIRWPKPEWVGRILPAIVLLEEGKEILDDML